MNKLKITKIYNYTRKYKRVDFNDGTGFLFCKAELNRWKLLIKELK